MKCKALSIDIIDIEFLAIENFKFSCSFFEHGYLIKYLEKTVEILYKCMHMSQICYLGHRLNFMKSRKSETLCPQNEGY